MTETTKEATKPNIATMTSAELLEHIKQLDEKHKQRMKALRALQRARVEEEAAE